MNFVDLVGQKFGCWEVTALIGLPSYNLHHCKWLCRCECGKTKMRVGSNLKKSKTTYGCHCGFTHRARPYEALYNTLVKLAKRREVYVGLTYEHYLSFVFQDECHYCGEHIVWKPYNKMNGHKLDRKDNSKGYILGNCVVCCPRCNRAKSDHFSYDEWVEIGDVIRRQRNRQILMKRRNSSGIKDS